jgi:hypothetical protein
MLGLFIGGLCLMTVILIVYFNAMENKAQKLFKRMCRNLESTGFQITKLYKDDPPYYYFSGVLFDHPQKKVAFIVKDLCKVYNYKHLSSFKMSELRDETEHSFIVTIIVDDSQDSTFTLNFGTDHDTASDLFAKLETVKNQSC